MRARPEQRFIIEIDRNHRMAEKARRFPVTRWTETFSPAMPTLEVDLGGVLRRHNSSSGTSRGRSSSDGLEDLLGRHMRRTQKAMGRQLSGPIAADLAQNQRAGGYHPLKQNRTCLLSTHIAKITDARLFIDTHHCLRPRLGAVNHRCRRSWNREIFPQGLLTTGADSADHRIKLENAVAPPSGRWSRPSVR